MMNDAFMEKCADRFADRVRRESGTEIDPQIDRVWTLSFARLPSDKEREIARAFIKQHGLSPLCLVIFNANEFLFIN